MLLFQSLFVTSTKNMFSDDLEKLIFNASPVLPGMAVRNLLYF